MPSKLKRFPDNSYSIILKFDSRENREECIDSKEYGQINAKLASLTLKYQCKIEYVNHPKIKKET